MGLLTFAALLGAGAQAYSAINPPKAATQQSTAPVAGGKTEPAESVFTVKAPGKAGTTPGGVMPNAPDFTASLLQGLLQMNPTQGAVQAAAPMMAPTGMVNGAPNIGGVGKAAAGQAQATNAAANTGGMDWSKILGSMPEALAAAAPFLAMFDKQQRSSTIPIGAQGGGAGGSMVAGLNLPRRTTLPELLASLPRPRYG